MHAQTGCPLNRTCMEMRSTVRVEAGGWTAGQSPQAASPRVSPSSPSFSSPDHAPPAGCASPPSTRRVRRGAWGLHTVELLRPASPYPGRQRDVRVPSRAYAPPTRSKFILSLRRNRRGLDGLGGLLREEDAKALLERHAVTRELVVRREAGCAEGREGEVEWSERNRFGGHTDRQSLFPGPRRGRTRMRRLGRGAIGGLLLHRKGRGGMEGPGASGHSARTRVDRGAFRRLPAAGVVFVRRTLRV